MTIRDMARIKEKYHLTYQQISADSGVPIGTVQKVLSGTTKHPRSDTVYALERTMSRYQYGGTATDHKPHYVSPTVYDRSPFPNSIHSGGIIREHLGKYYADGNTVENVYGTDGPYTLEDREKLPEERRTELIDGVLYDMASPSLRHQVIIQQIQRQMENCIDAHNSSCFVIQSPTDIVLAEDHRTVVVPDLSIVCDHRKITEKHVQGAPDFVMEVLSPSTKVLDYTVKLNLYREAGVREYWIADPVDERILVYNLAHLRQETEDGSDLQFYTFDDQIPVLISNEMCKIDMTVVKTYLERLYT